jgi:hypothetical protein
VEPRRGAAADAVAVLLNLWELVITAWQAIRLIRVCLRDPGLAFKSKSRGRVGIAGSVGSVPTGSYF